MRKLYEIFKLLWIQKRIVAAATIWGNTVGICVMFNSTKHHRIFYVCKKMWRVMIEVWRVICKIHKQRELINLHLQNSECLSSEPSIQWCTVSQTRSSLMQVLVLEHWKLLEQPCWVTALKAVITILKPFSAVPQESVIYFNVT